MSQQPLTERKLCSMTPTMAQLVEDIGYETREKSDAAVIRAAIELATTNKDEWRRIIQANKSS